MSFNSDYAKLRKKRLEEQQKRIAASQNAKERFVAEYSQLPYNRLAGGDIDDIGPVATNTTQLSTDNEEKKNSWFTALMPHLPKSGFRISRQSFRRVPPTILWYIIWSRITLPTFTALRTSILPPPSWPPPRHFR